MFDRWAGFIARWRWLVLAAGAALLVAGLVWGTGVFAHLTGGGFDDPDSESTIAQERIEAELGGQGDHVLVLFSSPTATVDQPAFREPVTATLARVRADPAVQSVTSWYDTGAPALVSADRHATYAAVRLAAPLGDEDALLDAYEQVEPSLAAPGVRTQVGGLVAFFHQANAQTERDLVRAESVSFPILLVLLVVIFRSLVAATMPLLIGALAILGAFVTTRLLTLVTEVSIFAINIITVIGLAMAIDYSLFVVSRFREELAAGRTIREALGHTLATAGRTVLVSGLTVVLAFASVLIFPQAFLRSLALGGMAAVGIAMLGALTVLPALLAVLGRRVDAGRVRLRRDPGRDRHPVDGAWARLASTVMRRPVIYAVAVLAVLAILASPVPRLEFGGFDERVLPEGSPARVVGDRIDAEFPTRRTDPILVLVSGGNEETVRAYAAELTALPEVTEATVAARRGGSALVLAGYRGDPTEERAWEAVREIRELPPPAGTEVLVGGRTAADLDLVDSLRAHLPWMALLMAATIMVLLFLAFGSVVLPVKAVLMSVVSIAAAFGVVVWGFQEGHLADLLGFTSTGAVEPSNLVLMFAILFGLSTDYEVFLLSRVREEWDRTGDNTTSVALGLEHTGRIITAAALLLIVVVGGFATGEMSYVKLLGVGMVVAIALDATLVRVLLVPATMRLLGHWNWWAPGALGRVYRRYGIHEPSERISRR